MEKGHNQNQPHFMVWNRNSRIRYPVHWYSGGLKTSNTAEFGYKIGTWEGSHTILVVVDREAYPFPAY